MKFVYQRNLLILYAIKGVKYSFSNFRTNLFRLFVLLQYFLLQSVIRIVLVARIQEIVNGIPAFFQLALSIIVFRVDSLESDFINQLLDVRRRRC